ncbi:hypothetical protein BU17DRAFT_63609 [Hysterangium stoloniferum]|nr:hypothetical protein BU17DRAFT_63609 [Hysterangium stoloniferum]
MHPANDFSCTNPFDDSDMHFPNVVYLNVTSPFDDTQYYNSYLLMAVGHSPLSTPSTTPSSLPSSLPTVFEEDFPVSYCGERLVEEQPRLNHECFEVVPEIMVDGTLDIGEETTKRSSTEGKKRPGRRVPTANELRAGQSVRSNYRRNDHLRRHVSGVHVNSKESEELNMPGPVLYVVVAVVGVAVAGVAFKEFVYDPHVAPKLEAWTSTYAAFRKERRRKRAAPHKNIDDDEGESSRTVDKASVELEPLIDRGINTPGEETSLRRRNPALRSSDESILIEKPNSFIPFTTLSPDSTSHSPSRSENEPTLPTTNMPLPLPLPGTISPEMPSQNSNTILQAAESPFGEDTSQNPFHSPVLSNTHFISPDHRAPSGSELNSGVTSSITSEDISRMGTPFTDAMSGPGGLVSDASFSDIAHSEIFSATAEEYPRTHRVDHTVFDAGDAFADSHSDGSFESSDSSSLDDMSEDLDESGLHGNRNALSDEEWERLSEAAR